MEKEKVSKQLDFGATPTPVKRKVARYGTTGNKIKCTPQFMIGFVVMFSLIILTFYAGVTLGSRFSVVHKPIYGAPNGVVNSDSNDKNVDTDGSDRNSGRLRGVSSSSSSSSSSPIDPTTINPSKLKLDQFLRSSLQVSDRAYLTASSSALSFATTTLIGAWIYLSPNIPNNGMRTILSNKLSGCDATSERRGFAMFINPWQGKDRRVHIEYGNSHSGCNKVASISSIEIGRWTHIASLISTDAIKIYIDGVESGGIDLTEPHGIEINPSSELRLGHYNAMDNQDIYPLNGNISTFAVVKLNDHAGGKLSYDDAVSGIKDIDKVRSLNGLALLYSLQDAAHEVFDSTAIDSLGKFPGKYHFPKHGSIMGLHIDIVDGTDGKPITDEMMKKSDELGLRRREEIKKGMQHAWQGYKKYAWGKDELKPQSKRGTDNWGGMGVTLVDSLDTLWLLGMMNEFNEAKNWVQDSLTFSRAGTVSTFETCIRELGGLLSAYEFSKDRVFLAKAQELGKGLAKSFDTISGIPAGQVNIATASGGARSAGHAILSELGSLQIEFRYLSKQTGDPSFERKSMKPMQLMYEKMPSDGLFPIKINIRDGSFADTHVTFGALGDSFYEYALKIWLQGGKKETWLRTMYDQSIQGMIDKLLQTSSPSGLAYIADWNGHAVEHKMDHLVCFMPGTMALGAYTDPLGLESPRAQRDLAIAKALMYTCYQMYNRMDSGISAEYVRFERGKDFAPGKNVAFYILRPETAESLFVLNQLTGDPIYREWAWEIWMAIEKNCKTATGYGALSNVQKRNSKIDDRMESFFLAETIKYLYLAQDPEKPVDLMKMVFNTEAHPMAIFDDDHTPVKEQ